METVPPTSELTSTVPAAPVPQGRRGWILAALGGLLLGLSFPGLVAPGSPAAIAPGLVAWVALVPLLAVLGGEAGWRGDFKAGLAFGVAFQAVLNHWLLAMHPLTWLGIPYDLSLVVVGVCLVGVAVVIGFGSAVFGVLYGNLVRRWRSGGLPIGGIPLLAACAWMVFEWLQAQGDLAYPWGPLALTQVETPHVLQAISLVGPYPLGGLIAFAAAAIVERWRSSHGVVKVVPWLFLAWLGIGHLSRPAETTEGAVTAAVVQGNFPSDQKWDPARLDRMVDRYVALSRSADSRVVVWPESALPILWNAPDRPDTRAVLARLREQFPVGGERRLVTGAFFARPDSEGQPPALMNAATVLGGSPGPWLWEAKRHLVPFGEFLPFRGILPDVLSRLNILSQDLARGEGPVPLDLGDAGGKIGTGICFDSIFPSALGADAAAGANVLAIVTNDAWYKDTSAPHQHFAHAILRAVETRRWVLRAANTGVSGIIGPDGRVHARTGTFKEAVATASFVPMTVVTPYSAHGDWPIGLAGVFLVLAWFAAYGRAPAAGPMAAGPMAEPRG
ncbi:MAG: apolipoprotein N-acyltransferase [Candidatus Sericytochromatia bacterium]|nr:apolipoprotein N-acyltransferase [Candidatus Sericytochromatia bacterium]